MAQTIKRSMLMREHQNMNANFRVIDNDNLSGKVVSHYAPDNDKKPERQQAETLALLDLTVLPRTGYKSRQTPDWLIEQGIDIPAEPNQAVTQADGSLVASLSWDEHLVLSDLALRSGQVQALDAAYTHRAGFMCYPLLRAHSHSWFAITGKHAPALFAKVCGVDMQPSAFANGRVAQTSVARTNGIVIRHDIGKLLVYYVLADSASAEYMWSGLLDAMDEWQGKAIGLDCLL